VTPEEFDACFDQFEVSAWRLQVRQDYLGPGEAERIAAWRAGKPRPERSVRTSPWLRRVAVTTAVGGKQWGRVQVIGEQVSDYLQYWLVSAVESAAAGEDIRIANGADAVWLERDAWPEFWLFDAGRPTAHAVLMHYNDQGAVEEYELVDGGPVLDDCHSIRELALWVSVPLNFYLAAGTRGSRLGRTA
jgi:hypothetical protein